MKRTATAAILACTILLTVSIASPAIGGPSVGAVAKTAKKALATGKSAKRSAASAKRSAASAKRTADTAHRTATNANGLAASANSKADQALGRPTVNPAGITTVTANGAIEIHGVGGAAAVCPAGQRAISGGVVSVAVAGGTWLDRASDDRTAWIGAGEDLDGSGGTVTVYAYCVPAGAATIAGTRRAKANAELRAAKRAKESLRRH